jgi:hypothetical protein
MKWITEILDYEANLLTSYSWIFNLVPWFNWLLNAHTLTATCGPAALSNSGLEK